jgi:hypothetical protein
VGVTRFFKPKLPTNYSEQTYASPYFIVRYPHHKRIQTAIQAAVRVGPTTLLDYGAGDGKVVIEAIKAGLPRTTSIVVFEPVEHFREKLRAAAEKAGVTDRIELVSERVDLTGRSFDYVLCLSVLEHMPLPERAAFYDVCEQTLTQTGTVLIDVPIEVGPTLLVKALARMALKGRSKEYGLSELLRVSIGGLVFDPARFDPANTGTWIHDHRGFDYRLLRRELAHRFTIESEVTTPLSAVPGPLGNQEMFFTLKRGE